MYKVILGAYTQLWSPMSQPYRGSTRNHKIATATGEKVDFNIKAL